MSWVATAIVGGAVIGGISTNLASDKASDAAAQAGQQQLALGREQLAATKPLRDLALEQAQFQFGQQQQLSPEFLKATLGALGLLGEDINRQAGTGLPFQQRQEQGVSNIVSSLAPFGLTDSSVSGRAIGDFSSNLLSQDIENLQNQRFKLAGFAPQTPSFFGGGTAGLGTSAQLQQGGILSGQQAGEFGAAGILGMGQSIANPLLQLGGFGLQQGGFGNMFSGTGTPIAGNVSPTSSFFQGPSSFA